MAHAMDVRSALRRLESASYGVCENCEEPIGTKRLRALPWASRCIRCQSADDLAAQNSQGPQSLWGDQPDVFFGGNPMTRCQPQATPRRSLESLMEAYQQADEQAFTELAHRLSPQLRGFFLGPHATRRHADDLLQDFWLRVHKARHTYEAGRPLLPWIYAIARYARTDAYRRMARVETQHEGEPDLTPDPKSLAGSAEARSEFRALMARLPARQRGVVLMLKAGGLTLDEAARATGSTIGATKQTAHRAYTNLRAIAQVLNQPTSYHAAAN